MPVLHLNLDKPLMLERMQSVYDFTQRTLALVPPEHMTTPRTQGDWSVKDLIAHLAAWNRRALRWIDEARRGEGVAGKHPIEPEPGLGWDSFDAINALTFERDLLLPLEVVQADFAESFALLLREAESFSEDELFGKAGLSLFFRDPLFNYIGGNTYHHYVEHMAALREWPRRLQDRSGSHSTG
jgi:hypothetical protein